MIKKSQDKPSYKKDVIPGIHCDVSNCVYNDKKCNCSAENIKVGPEHAESSADTVCATFKQQ